MVLGLLVGLFLAGCEKQPTEVEKPEAPDSSERLAKRSEGGEFQIGNFDPKPEIAEKMKKLMEERGDQQGSLEFLANVKRVKPEEYEKYNIKPMTESEIREYASTKGSTMHQEGDGWWIEGHAWVTPWFGWQGNKCVYLGFSSIASEIIDYIDYYGEVWVDYNPFVYYSRYKNSSNNVGVTDWWYYPESESHQWDVYGSHGFGDEELFYPITFIRLEWTHAYTYH